MLDLLRNIFSGKSTNPAIATVEIYTWQLCPYCIRAKFLLNWKQAAFTEYKIDGDSEARAAMATRANGRKSVPQIFINGVHIGGCDELHALDAEGKLDPLLSVAAD
jgi:glutaredoxin 3